jgi:hypothetical protein
MSPALRALHPAPSPQANLQRNLVLQRVVLRLEVIGAVETRAVLERRDARASRITASIDRVAAEASCKDTNTSCTSPSSS